MARRDSQQLRRMQLQQQAQSQNCSEVVFFICFSMRDQRTLEHCISQWIPEAVQCNPKAPFVLVGLQHDDGNEEDNCLQHHKWQRAMGQTPVTVERALQVAKQYRCSTLELVSAKRGIPHDLATRILQTAVRVLQHSS